MYGRLMLAAIDWNSSERIPRLDKDGNSTMSVVYSKRRKDFVLKGNYVRKKTDVMTKLTKTVSMTHKEKKSLSPFKRPALPKNVAPVEKPDKQTMLSKYRSRITRS